MYKYGYNLLISVRSESLSHQLKQAKSNSEMAKQELKDYKDKASRILQVIIIPQSTHKNLHSMLSVLVTVYDIYYDCLIVKSKDKLIASMSAGAGADNSFDMSAGVSAELEQERNLLRTELQQSVATIDSLRMELQVCSSKYLTLL